VVLRRLSQQRLQATLRANWGAPVDRERDMPAIASYHFAMTGTAAAAPALDDRTWADLNLDDIFAVLDRTQSSIGQQALYRRLRAAPQAPHLDAFERVTDRLSHDPALRERVQLSLAKLSDKAGYDLWLLAQPDILKTEAWFVLFPIVAVTMVAALAAAIFWTPALVIVALGVAHLAGPADFAHHDEVDWPIEKSPSRMRTVRRTPMRRSILADLAIFPITPSALDLRSVSQATTVLKYAQSINQGRPGARLVLNRMRNRDTISRELQAAAPTLGLAVANSLIRDLQVFLDAATPSDDENARLKPLPSRALKRGDMRIKVDLPSYGITFLALEKRN
jgi:hypothetical protein